MLDKVKTALQLTDTTFDSEINTMIEEAKKDMILAGVDEKSIPSAGTDVLYEQAIVLFCVFRFELFHGSASRSAEIERLYKEQKRQLGMATGYTTW